MARSRWMARRFDDSNASMRLTATHGCSSTMLSRTTVTWCGGKTPCFLKKRTDSAFGSEKRVGKSGLSMRLTLCMRSMPEPWAEPMPMEASSSPSRYIELKSVVAWRRSRSSGRPSPASFDAPVWLKCSLRSMYQVMSCGSMPHSSFRMPRVQRPTDCW